MNSSISKLNLTTDDILNDSFGSNDSLLEEIEPTISPKALVKPVVNQDDAPVALQFCSELNLRDHVNHLGLSEQRTIYDVDLDRSLSFITQISCADTDLSSTLTPRDPISLDLKPVDVDINSPRKTDETDTTSRRPDGIASPHVDCVESTSVSLDDEVKEGSAVVESLQLQEKPQVEKVKDIETNTSEKQCILSYTDSTIYRDEQKQIKLDLVDQAKRIEILDGKLKALLLSYPNLPPADFWFKECLPTEKPPPFSLMHQELSMLVDDIALWKSTIDTDKSEKSRFQELDKRITFLQETHAATTVSCGSDSCALSPKSDTSTSENKPTRGTSLSQITINSDSTLSSPMPPVSTPIIIHPNSAFSTDIPELRRRTSSSERPTRSPRNSSAAIPECLQQQGNTRRRRSISPSPESNTYRMKSRTFSDLGTDNVSHGSNSVRSVSPIAIDNSSITTNMHTGGIYGDNVLSSSLPKLTVNLASTSHGSEEAAGSKGIRSRTHSNIIFKADDEEEQHICNEEGENCSFVHIESPVSAKRKQQTVSKTIDLKHKKIENSVVMTSAANTVPITHRAPPSTATKESKSGNCRCILS